MKPARGHSHAFAGGRATLSTFGGSLLSLEARIMFDGAAVATVSTVTTEQIAQSQAEASFSADDAATTDTAPAAPTGEPQPTTGDQALFDALAAYDTSVARQEIVFLSPSVREYQQLLDGISPNVEVFVLDPARDGVEQMAEILAGRTGIDAIHIISHGAPAELTLGTARLTFDSMNGIYANELAVIGQSLSEKADLLIYGCKFGLGQDGAEATMRLGQLTGADVAASTDDTGHASLGGDWDLEFAVGGIEPSQVFTMDVKQNWSHLMATETILDNFSSASYSNNNGTQSWSTSWVETETGGAGPGAGNILITSGQLFIDAGLGSGGNNVYREVNLTGALSATLSYAYNAALGIGGAIEVQISDDGGANYTTLETYTSLLPASGTGNFDITSYLSANTRLRFEVTGTLLFNNIQFDNVEISYITNDAPVNTVPGAQTVTEDTALAIGGLSVNDVDGNLSTVQLGVTQGTVTVSLAGGATISSGANGTATFTLSGTQAQINAALASLVYQGTLNYSGPDTLTVTSTDGNAVTDVDTVAITVSPVNDAPVVTSNGGGATASVNVAENQVFVTTVTSADVDGGVPTYSIIGGADAALFTLNAATGALTFNNAPDFETPVDVGANNVYDVTVQATDGSGGTDLQALSIMVTDVSEGLPPSTPPPVIPPSLVPQPPTPPPGGGLPPVGSPPLLPPIVVGTPVNPQRNPGSPVVPVGLGNSPGGTAPPLSEAAVVAAHGGGNTPEPSVPLMRELRGYLEERVAPLIHTAEEIQKALGGQTPEQAPVPLSAAFRKTLMVVEEDLRRATDMSESNRKFAVGITNMGGISLTAGVITWLLRSGSLLASLTATMPAWRHFDPLPVVLVGDRKRRKRKADMAAAADQENKQFRGLRDLLDRKGENERSDGGGIAG